MSNVINLNINGKPCTGKAGQTILQACRDNGVFIPTLCHDERLNPFGSCMICRVEVEGSKGTMLACGAEITEGMVIRTDTEAVRAARKVCLELLASQHYGDCKAPCTIACPAHVDIQGYVGLIANGRFAEALELIKKENPLPIVCGRICTRPCESECRRNILEGPVGIAHLKRFVADIDVEKDTPYLPEKKPASGKRVAIIGAGPAGLSAAWYLAADGHEVKIFEKHSAPGGMLRYGIPSYRLPREALDLEVNIIKSLGVEIQYNTDFGSDITLDSLKTEGYDAVLLAVGSQVGQPLGVDGEQDCKNSVLRGVSFLGDCTRGTQPDFKGKRIVVVGGGNTAMDCARSSIRLGAQSVTLVYRRTKNEMPADKAEIEEAELEGVKYMFLTNPKAVRMSGKCPVLTMIRMELGEPDASGRRSPREIAGSEFDFEADYVIAAIGQTQDLSFIGDACPVTVNRNRLAADEKTGCTNLEGVFAAGDAVTGPKTAILAIAGGHNAARAIDKYLKGEKITPPAEFYNHQKAKHYSELDPAEFDHIAKAEMEPMPMISISERVSSFKEVELGLTEEQALREAARCLSCGCKDVAECKLREYATEYKAEQNKFAGQMKHHPIDESHPYIVRDPNKCIMCGRCVRICNEVAGQGVLGFIGRGYGVTVQPSFSKPFGEDESCIKCGQCVSSCPVGALTEKIPFKQPGPFEEKVTDTICTFCGAGCAIELRTNGDKVVRTTANVFQGINGGNLCEKGRFKNTFINLDRLNKPLIRRNGSLVEVTMEQAMQEIKEKVAGNVNVYISGRSTNEQAELLAGLGTPLSFGIDPVAASFYSACSGQLVTSYSDIKSADLIVAISCDVMGGTSVPMMAARHTIRMGAKYLKAVKITNEVKNAVEQAKSPVIILGNFFDPDILPYIAMLDAKVLIPAAKANTRGVAEYLDLEKCSNSLFSPAETLIIWGEDPIGYDNAKARELIRNAKFIVVADVRLTETARAADVVLPLGGFACGGGSFTNVFGISQSLQKAIEGYDDYLTAKMLSEALNSKPGRKRSCAALLSNSDVIVSGADTIEL